jgi:MFS family permease
LSLLSGNRVVTGAFLIFVGTMGANTAFGVFFKPMLNDFGWTKAMTSGAFSLSWIINGIVGIAMGKFNDRFGSRGVITISGLLLSSGYLIMSQVNAVWHLYLFYGVIVGTGMSGIWVPVMSTIARSFGDRRGMMTAIVMVGGGLGTLVAPPISNWLISVFAWRTSYVIVGSLVFLFVVLPAQFLRNTRPRVDGVSPGQPEKRQNERDPRANPGARHLSLREAIGTRRFWLSSSMVFWFGFSSYVILVHVVPYMTEVGISAATAANVLAVLGGLNGLSRFVLGSASNRIGNRQVFIVGFVMVSAASFWLLLGNRVWELYLFAVVFGFGLGAGVSHSPLIAELFGLTSHGVILGVNVLGYSLGSAAGPFVAGYLFDVTGDYQLAFLACAVSGIAGLVCTALISHPDRNDSDARFG